MKKIMLLAVVLLAGCEPVNEPAPESKSLPTRESDIRGGDTSSIRVYCRHGWQIIVNPGDGMVWDLDEDGNKIPCNGNIKRMQNALPDKPRL